MVISRAPRRQPCGELDQKVAALPGKPHTDRRAEQRQNQSFRRQLAQEPAAPRTQRRPDHEFALPPRNARQRQIRDIGASDQQHESCRRQHHQQHRPGVALQLLLQSGGSRCVSRRLGVRPPDVPAPASVRSPRRPSGNVPRWRPASSVRIRSSFGHRGSLWLVRMTGTGRRTWPCTRRFRSGTAAAAARTPITVCTRSFISYVLPTTPLSPFSLCFQNS